jgi:hypothetical protein
VVNLDTDFHTARYKHFLLLFLIVIYIKLKGDFLDLKYLIQHGFICRPLDSALSQDAGIKTRTVATLAVAFS